MMLLCIPLIILGYMGYEYYVGTHVTAASLDKVAEQQQEELLENREEDKRLQDADARKQRSGEMVAARIRSKANDISNELRSLKVQYRNGSISRSSARSQAQSLAQQAKDMLNESTNLSQADREVLEQLIDNVVAEADSIGASRRAAALLRKHGAVNRLPAPRVRLAAGLTISRRILRVPIRRKAVSRPITTAIQAKQINNKDF